MATETTITYRNDTTGDNCAITLGRRDTTRQPSDVCISRILAHDCPLKLAVLVHADGSVAEWYARWYAADDNTYWHLDHGSEEDATGEYAHRPARPLTPAQRETLIRIWGKQIRPFGVAGTCGAPVMRWVAPTRGEVETILDRPVVLTAPCDATEAIRGPGEPEAAADRIAAHEALLELAVEDGQLTGAGPADI